MGCATPRTSTRSAGPRLPFPTILLVALTVATPLACSEPPTSPFPDGRKPLEPTPSPKRSPQRNSRPESALTEARPAPLASSVRHIDISGSVDLNNATNARFDPPYRKRGACRSPRPSTVRNAGDIAHTRIVSATLYDAQGGVLDERTLEASETWDDRTRFNVMGCVSDDADGRRLLVRRGDVVLLDLRASAHQPVLRTLFPTADTRTVDRTRPDVFEWTSADEDGPLYSVRYSISFDGQQWWDHGGRNIGSGSASAFKESADLFGFASGDTHGCAAYGMEHVWLETEISDGFWSAHSVVGPFRIRDCDAPIGFPADRDACLDQGRRLPWPDPAP